MRAGGPSRTLEQALQLSVITRGPERGAVIDQQRGGRRRHLLLVAWFALLPAVLLRAQDGSARLRDSQRGLWAWLSSDNWPAKVGAVLMVMNTGATGGKDRAFHKAVLGHRAIAAYQRFLAIE